MNRSTPLPVKGRDHIFISYATEQSALCDWIARRLAANGYAVWYDRQKLLGGENWPNDIDEAIDKRTFRMLALLSRDSVKKPNPQGEWLKGVAIGRRIEIDDFVIPLNTDGLTSEEIPWNLQAINYIQFSLSWATGFSALTRKLESVDAPRTLVDGLRLVKESLSVDSMIRREPEVLVSNCFEVTQLPRFVCKYEHSKEMDYYRRRSLRRTWACRDVSATLVCAFDGPPDSVTELDTFRCIDKVPWRYIMSTDGIDTRDLVVGLVRGCITQLLISQGMLYCDASRNWYLPSGLLRGDRVVVKTPGGRDSWFKGVGERKFPTTQGGETYRYHLAPSFDILRDGDGVPAMLFVRNRVRLTDVQGKPLRGRKIASRRKHLCKYWFNREWCARTLGMAQLLADDDGVITYGPDGEQQLKIDASPISPLAPWAVNDEKVEEMDEEYSAWHDDGEIGDVDE